MYFRADLLTSQKLSSLKSMTFKSRLENHLYECQVGSREKADSSIP